MKNFNKYIDVIENTEDFLDSLKKVNDFEYLPCTKGLTIYGKTLNLGFSTYALKIQYMLNKSDFSDKKHLDNWAKYINSYQKTVDSFPANSFIDDVMLRSYKNKNVRGYIEDGVKIFLNNFSNKTYDSNKQKLSKAINAETKQAISTLQQIGHKSIKPYPTELSSQDVLNKLNSLDWSKPWNAGAQYSSYCVYSKTLDKDFSSTLIQFINGLVDKETGSYFNKNPNNNREVINGAMKVISGLDWLDEKIHYPDKLIDFCLQNNPIEEGCDIVDFVYVLFKCSQQSNHKRNEVNNLMLEILKVLEKLYKPVEKGFSYFNNKSQTHYYGVKISEGKDYADIHGTVLCLWAIIMILKNNQLIDDQYKLIKP